MVTRRVSEGTSEGQADVGTCPQKQFERRYCDSLTYVSGYDLLLR